MSAFGRGQAGAVGQEVIEVIRQVMREFDALGRSARGAAGGIGGSAFRFATDNFVTNASARAGRNFAIDATAGITSDWAKFGFGAKSGISFEQSATSSFLRSASRNLGPYSDVFAQIQNPLDAAENRVAGITAQIARAGGTVNPEDRKRLFELFHGQEQRAENERLEVEKLAKTQAGTGNVEGTRYAEFLDAIVDAKNAVKEWADWLRGSMGAHR